MADLFYRTEDIKPEEILKYFVETALDRKIVDSLKSVMPVILVGSRGVGKSFLLRVAEAELSESFKKDRILPVYVTFNKSSLIHTEDSLQFQHWMLALICQRILRTLKKFGLVSGVPETISILAGEKVKSGEEKITKIEKITEAYEESYKNPGRKIDLTGLPTVDSFKDSLEDLCIELSIKRIVIYIDEAAHIFLPDQQRQFFTLFRDLRSPYITCNAAVYPGVTSYGETFQPTHDAVLMSIDRNILDGGYVADMREIVEKQADSTLLSSIELNGENFAILAYASNGNPRTLLKTVAKTPKVTSQQINEIIRTYYRSDIWSEHSVLSDKYKGREILVDWGRKFIEDEVLPEIQKKNKQYIKEDKSTTCFFWINKYAPQLVFEALNLLAYTGIVYEHSSGIKATRSEIGTRYAVNLGCLLSLEATPAATGFQIAKGLTPKRMTEYGQNHVVYKKLLKMKLSLAETNILPILQKQLLQPINVLDITDWQKQQLSNLDLKTIGCVLKASEERLQEAPYVGPKRSRRISNAAMAAVLEYLSG